MICDVVGFRGEIIWDRSKPDGIPRKLLDVTKLNQLGWHPKISLREGIEQTYRWYWKQSAVNWSVRRDRAQNQTEGRACLVPNTAFGPIPIRS